MSQRIVWKAGGAVGLVSMLVISPTLAGDDFGEKGEMKLYKESMIYLGFKDPMICIQAVSGHHMRRQLASKTLSALLHSSRAGYSQQMRHRWGIRR